MAMALACGSRLLIADEPTTALDVTIQAQILRLMLRLREELAVAEIVITHNIGVAAQICDRIAVMYAGCVVEDGSAVDVLRQPCHPYTIALIECLPHGRKVSELQSIPGGVPDLIAPPDGCRFHPRCAHVMDVCRGAKPERVEVDEEHWVACFWAAGDRRGRESNDGVKP